MSITPVGDEGSPLRRRGLNYGRLEVRLEGELIFPGGVVRIGLRNGSEGRVSEACPTAAISDVEIRCVRNIEALRTELDLYTFRDGKVLEDG